LKNAPHVPARDLLIEHFRNFDQFPASALLPELIVVQFGDWQSALRCHPGYKARDTVQALIRLKTLLVQSVTDMHQHYDTLQERERARQCAGNLERERASDLVLKELIAFTALGSALVATARRHKSSRPEIADEIEKSMQAFFAPPISHFVKCLRTNHQHIRVHPTNWEILVKFGPSGGITARFYMEKDEILQTGEDWDKEALGFLEQREKLDPYEIAAEYLRVAITFVDEIAKLNNETPSAAVEHLSAVERQHDGWSARQQFKAMLQPFQKRTDFDPYSYLPKFFSEDEIRIIYSFPNGSKAQVDQMILIKDRWGMCDSELREMFYRFFRATSEK